jgi:dipeptidyl aminopeptidase/acylaminoacyl peptidase
MKSILIVRSVLRRRLATLAFAVRIGVPIVASFAAHGANAAEPAAPAPAAAATAGMPPPAEAFGTVPNMRAVALSPNGRTIAWAEIVGAEERVLAMDIATQTTRRTIPIVAPMKLRDITWADDETLLVELGATQQVDVRATYEFSRTLAVPMDGSPPKVLLMGGGDRKWVTSASIVALSTSRPKTIVMTSLDYSPVAERQTTGTLLAGGRKDAGWVGRIYSVDTRTGKGTMLASGTPFTRDWAVDSTGTPTARSEWLAERKLFTIIGRQGSNWREIFRLENGATLALYGLTADGSAVLALGAIEGNRSKLWAIPLDGSAPRVVVGDDERDVEWVRTDRFTLQPVAAYLGGIDQPRRWIDSRAEMKWRSVSRAFPDRSVEVYGGSQDGRRVLARVESPSMAPVYYFIDFDAKRADIVGEAYPKLVDVPLGRKTMITYAARDGTSIPAYLTVPPGPEMAGRPLVVLPHGGPEARDDADFDWVAQFLATRGYLVLQPQFRGSTGFGDEFRIAGRREWGGLMQDDVTDGVKALIAKGAADPKRVCIVGMSYGGYSALAGATLTPELYACAVSVSGVTDLPAMIGYEQSHWGQESDSLAYWRDHIGDVHDPKLAQRSPARLAANARAPILLLHGEDDTIVPIAQSRAMAQALAAAGKPHSLVALPGEDHWLSRSATRVRVLQEMERFLAQNLR